MYYRKTSLVLILTIILTNNIFAHGEQVLGVALADLLALILGISLILRSRVGWKYRIAILLNTLITVPLSFNTIVFIWESNHNVMDYFLLWTLFQFIAVLLIFAPLWIISEKFLKKKQVHKSEEIK